MRMWNDTSKKMISQAIASTPKALKVSDVSLVQEPSKKVKIYEQADGGGKIQNIKNVVYM